MSEKSEQSENHSTEDEFRRCHKCGGEMKTGGVHGDFRILKEGDMYGDRMYVFYCRDCGFVEFYKEPSTKESWRWPKKQEMPLTEELQQPEKEKRPPKETPKRRRLVR